MFDANDSQFRSDLQRLAPQFTDDELATFARRFLECNDFLLPDVKFDEQGSGEPRRITYVPKSVEWPEGPVEKLAMAWNIHHREQERFLASALGFHFTSHAFSNAVRSLTPLSGLLAGFAHDQFDRSFGINRLSRLGFIEDALGPTSFRGIAGQVAGVGLMGNLPGSKFASMAAQVGNALGPKIGNMAAQAAGASLIENSLVPAFRNMAAEIAGGLDMGSSMWTSIERMTKILPHLANTENICCAAVGSIVRGLGRLERPADELLAARLMAPATAYVNFLDDVSKRALMPLSAHQVVALDTAVWASNRLFTAANEAVSSLLDQQSVPGDDDGGAEEAPELNLFERQLEELLSLAADNGADEETSRERLIVKSTISPLSFKASRIFRLMADCNAQCKFSSKDEIFRSSGQVLRAASTLPLLVPDNLATLMMAVNYIYFSLYEGAGSDKLRFLAPLGPLDREKDAEICQPIWNLKMLRNKWLNHDPDRGDANAIGKSYKDLIAAFQAFGLRGIPQTAEEFGRLYEGLIDRIVVFMERLYLRLRDETPGN
ncbi:MAG: hypothetical protein IPK80_29115 [Nannocystis sp.]|nr:hypothetical protein [Nannocystis sp.]